MKRHLDSAAVMRVLIEVQDAASVFEGRWTLGALARVDPALAGLLDAQIKDYQEASVKGTMADFKEQAAGCVRGYHKCAQVMERAGAEDDAYTLGIDSKSGLRVAIGDRRASARRVAAVHGPGVVWLTGDEVARLYSSLGGLASVTAIKAQWPGAEMVDLRHITMPQTAEHMPLHPDDEAAMREREDE